MEISLQRAINYYSIHTQRRNMIYAENLHMLDRITYDKFKQLHLKYAPNIDEKDFARYFLDVDYMSYYKLSTGRLEASILEREFYKEEEFSEIAYRIFAEKQFENISVDYETLTNLHKEFGDRFSLKQFAEEVFGINSHRVDDIKFDQSKTAKIKITDENLRASILKIRKKVILEAGLHIGMQISLDEFNNLYQTYGISEIDEKIFAHKVLGITDDTFLRFKKGKRDRVIILLNFPINPEYIVRLREKVIISEHLCIDDAIDNEQFYKLYQKYGGILTEELFAEEILDISWEAVKQAKRNDHKNKILGKISVSEEDFISMREFIMKEHSLRYNQLLDYPRLHKLYNKYGFPLSEVQFAKDILGIPYEEYYYELKNGNRQSCYILVNTQKIDFSELRKSVIEKECLHFADKINYKKLKQLHKKYAPSVKETDFARKVLDIPVYCLGNIRRLGQNTTILLEEQLPKSEQLVEIQEIVILKYNLTKGQAISYMKFKQIYKAFGGIMPEDMFAKVILNISEQSLKEIKANKEVRTNILSDLKVSSEELKISRQKKDDRKLRKLIIETEGLHYADKISYKQFKTLHQKYKPELDQYKFAILFLDILPDDFNQMKDSSQMATILLEEKLPTSQQLTKIQSDVIKKYKLSIGKTISYRMFLKMYKDIGGIMPEDMFAKEILDISDQDLDEIKKNKDKKVAILLESDITPEKIERLKKSSSDEKIKLLEKVKRILDNYIVNETNINTVKKYIELCDFCFENGEFDFQELSVLKDSIEFIQGNIDEIKVYIKICVSREEYSKGIQFILDNIDNEGITQQSQDELAKMRSMLQNAIMERNIIIMYRNGQSIETISERTDLSKGKVAKIIAERCKIEQHRKENSAPEDPE